MGNLHLDRILPVSIGALIAFWISLNESPEMTWVSMVKRLLLFAACTVGAVYAMPPIDDSSAVFLGYGAADLFAGGRVGRIYKAVEGLSGSGRKEKANATRSATKRKTRRKR